MTMRNTHNFGDRVRRYRRAAELTQEELAERVDLSVCNLSNLERGTNCYSYRDTARALAQNLRLTDADRTFLLDDACRREPTAMQPVGAYPSTAAASFPPTTADSSTGTPVRVVTAPAAPAERVLPLASIVPVGMPSGTVTFLITDIEGSTHLLRTLGERYEDVLATQRELLRRVVATHGGTEVDHQGDACFFVFPRARDALSAAAAGQRALAAHRWPGEVAVRVRMGLHTGEPRLGRTGYVGMDVHRAARIADAGHGGQVLLSSATAQLVEQDLPDDMMLRDLGEHRLKDLRRGEHILQLVCADLPAKFPPLQSLERHRHNLPIQPTPLVGREREIAGASMLLRRDDVRLMTLTGPGGIGKTRLAIQVAAELVDDFADGVYFLRLSRLTDPTLVLPTIAQTLGLKEAGSQLIAETLREYVRGRQILLVLDNFEQIVAAASDMGSLLESADRLKVLVTSRMPLRLRGEHEYTVTPLALPNRVQSTDLESLAHSAAVSLFVQRAQEVKSDFALTAANAPALAEICAQLDGLPLAIELAAARVKLLPPEALLARLSCRLKLLTGGTRDLEERQRTMRATIAWSEDLLSLEERILFRRLSVFVGGCTLEAADAICLAPEGAEPLDLDLLDGLAALVDHSLLQQREEGGVPRFGMLHVIREYALERLDEQGEEAEAIRRAHLGYYGALAEQAPQEYGGLHEGPGFAQLEREHDNLRTALGCAHADAALARADAVAPTSGTVSYGAPALAEGLRLAGALAFFWLRRGYLSEGRDLLEELLALAAAGSHGVPAEPNGAAESDADMPLRAFRNSKSAWRMGMAAGYPGRRDDPASGCGKEPSGQ